MRQFRIRTGSDRGHWGVPFEVLLESSTQILLAGLDHHQLQIDITEIIHREEAIGVDVETVIGSVRAASLG